MTTSPEAHDFLVDALRNPRPAAEVHSPEAALERSWQVARYLGPKLVNDYLFRDTLKVRKFESKGWFKGGYTVLGKGMLVTHSGVPPKRKEWRPGDKLYHEVELLHMGGYALTDPTDKGVYFDRQGILFGYFTHQSYGHQPKDTSMYGPSVEISIHTKLDETPISSYEPGAHQVAATEVLDGLVSVAGRNYQPDQAGVLVPLQRPPTPRWA